MGLEGLDNLIKGLEAQDSWQAQRQFRLVLRHWPKAVGFAVARQTRPTSIHRSELYVATATSVWAQTLTYERFKILQKLNRYQPKPIKNIRFSTALWESLGASLAKASETKGIRDRLQQPGSRQLVNTQPSNIRQAQPSAPTPTNPSEAFARWARSVQQMHSSQPLCPSCQCRCPQEELERWSVCALCATKQWRSQ